MTETTDYPQGEVPPETLRRHFDAIASLMEQQRHLMDELRVAKADASAEQIKPAVLVSLVREQMKAAKVGEFQLAAEEQLEEEYRAKLGLG